MAGTKLSVQHLSEEVDEELYDEMWDIYRDFEEDQLGPLEEEFDEEKFLFFALFVFSFTRCTAYKYYGAVFH